MLSRAYQCIKNRAMSTMRGAIVKAFGSPDNIVIMDDLQPPTISDANQVLIDVRTAGINPVDTYIRAGTYARLPHLPYVPGRDGCGIVKQVGTGVTHVNVGDRVWFFDAPTGSSAEITVATAVFALPIGLSFAEGACLGVPYLTVHRALCTRGQLKTGDRVLIHGASGGVGLAACQLARHLGASLVVGTAGTQHGERLAAENGAHHTVCHRSADYVNKLRKLAPQGFDLIVEMLANVNLSTDLELVARGGRIGIVGCRGTTTINPRLFMQKEATAYGVMLSGATSADMAECASLLTSLFDSSIRPVVSSTYRLDHLARAHVDIIDESLPAAGNRILLIRE